MRRALVLFAAAVTALAFSIPPVLTLALGVVLSAAGASPRWSGSAAKVALVATIFVIGCRMEPAALTRVDASFLLITATIVGSVLAVGTTRLMRAAPSSSCALLISAGTAICGGSAIATLAPIVRARAVDVGVAMSVVFACNAVALATLPAVGALLGLDAELYGLWCALAVHETSSVVSAAAELGSEAAEVATLGKLVRALCILPVALALTWVRAEASARSRGLWRAFRSPALLAFGAALALVALRPELKLHAALLGEASHYGIRLVMLFTGLSVAWSDLKATGLRLFLSGLGLWIFVATATLALLVGLRLV